MFSIYGDFSESSKFLNEILANVESSNKFLASRGRELLKESNKRAFRQQKTPDGITWTSSVFSQIDPTGSPRMTMLRSTVLFQDTQDNKNYVMNYMTLEQYTTAASDKNFLYGDYHNTKDPNKPKSGRWNFSGLDLQAFNALKEDYTNYIFGKK